MAGLVVVRREDDGEIYTVRVSRQVTSRVLVPAGEAQPRLAPVTYLEEWREGS
jgi:hypothetical protein